MRSYIQSSLSPYLFGFRKGHSTDQCLNAMLESWKKAFGNKMYAVLTDLSKDFDCLNHELLITKLHAYGFRNEALTFINDILSNRTQRMKEASSNGAY